MKSVFLTSFDDSYEHCSMSDRLHELPAEILVSIIIPTHNVSEWIAETLATVLTQSFPKERIEIIVVDDGSSDNTCEIVRAILDVQDMMFQVISIVQGGPSRARNIGWKASTGQWLQFLDGDDLLHPSKIEKQVLAASEFSSAAVVYSSWARYTCSFSEWTCKELVLPSIGSEAPVDLICSGNFIATGSQLFSRRWIEKVGGFDEKYRLIEDVDLLVRIAIYGGQFLFVPSIEPLFYYRQRNGSLSRTSTADFVDACVRNASKVEEYCRSTKRLTQYATKTLAGVYFYGCRFYAEFDINKFDRLVERINCLLPSFIPEGSSSMRILSRLLGYRQAELFAVGYRRFRRTLFGRALIE